MYPSLFTNLQSIPLIFLDLRALLLLRAAPPLAGNRLRPQTEVVFRNTVATMSTYMSIYQCMH